MFDYPTTAAIADYLVKKLPEAANAIAAVRPGPEECLQAFGPSTDSDLCRTQIVAISSRHPGPSLGIDGFMESMLASTDLQAQPPLGRWDNDANYTPDLLPSRMTATTRFGAFCEGLEHFDALAFRLSLAEALVVDPQTRQAAACGEQCQRACELCALTCNPCPAESSWRRQWHAGAQRNIILVL